MQDYDKTTYFSSPANQTASSLVTIFDGNAAPRTLRLSEFGKNLIYLGQDLKNEEQDFRRGKEQGLCQ